MTASGPMPRPTWRARLRSVRAWAHRSKSSWPRAARPDFDRLGNRRFDLDRRDVAPEIFQVVVRPRIGREDVEDDVDVIRDDPARLADALDAVRDQPLVALQA